jgi:glycine cleavage system H protein
MFDTEGATAVFCANLSGSRQRAHVYKRAPFLLSVIFFIKNYGGVLMNFPGDLKYTMKDEWVRIEGNVGVFGITDYAQDQLSDIVFFEFAVSEEDLLSKDDEFGTIESVKAASDIYTPASGKVVSLNENLLDTPEIVNSDPYGDAWMLKIELSDPSELDELMDASAYEAYTKEREA